MVWNYLHMKNNNAVQIKPYNKQEEYYIGNKLSFFSSALNVLFHIYYTYIYNTYIVVCFFLYCMILFVLWYFFICSAKPLFLLYIFLVLSFLVVLTFMINFNQTKKDIKTLGDNRGKIHYT